MVARKVILMPAEVSSESAGKGPLVALEPATVALETAEKGPQVAQVPAKVASEAAGKGPRVAPGKGSPPIGRARRTPPGPRR